MLLKSSNHLSRAHKAENNFFCNVSNNFSGSVCFVALAPTPTPINPCECIYVFDTRSRRELPGSKTMKAFAIVKVRELRRLRWSSV